MSLLCMKLRSFISVILHPDCLSSPSPPPPRASPSPPTQLLPPPSDVTCGQRLQDETEESPIAIANGSRSLRCDAGLLPVCPSRMAGEPAAHHGPAVHLQPQHHQQPQAQQPRPARARSSPDGASAILVPSSIAAAAPTKPVQNIYRKPMSRINSNPSLRRSRDQHFRCNQRLSRHVQLWESDPGDVSYYYSPSGSTQLPGVGSTQGQGEEDLQGAQDYRRRVYTMPSAVPPQSGPDAQRASYRRKVPRSLEIKRETAQGRGCTQSPKDKQPLIPYKDLF